jgi:hypothetical protein
LAALNKDTPETETTAIIKIIKMTMRIKKMRKITKLRKNKKIKQPQQQIQQKRKIRPADSPPPSAPELKESLLLSSVTHENPSLEGTVPEEHSTQRSL